MSYIDEKLITLSTVSNNVVYNNGTFKSDVEFKFNTILKDTNDIIRASISILSAQIPVSFYNINVYTDVLKIQIGVSVYTITLTNGNYNSTTLVAEMQIQLIAQGLTDFTIVYSSTTGKMTISRATSFTILFSGSTILGVLGYSQTIDTVGLSLTGINPLNLLGSLRVRVLSTQLSTLNIDSSIKGGISLLASIPIEAPPYGVILFDNYNKSSQELKSLDITDIDLQLVDDNGNLINFNNIDWSITMVMYIERKSVEKSNTRFRDVIFKPLISAIKDLGEKIQNDNATTTVPEAPIAPEVPEMEDTDDLFDMFYQNGITL